MNIKTEKNIWGIKTALKVTDYFVHPQNYSPTDIPYPYGTASCEYPRKLYLWMDIVFSTNYILTPASNGTWDLKIIQRYKKRVGAYHQEGE